MGIEVDRKGEQGPLSQVIQDLEAKNRKFDGMLFSTFGSNRERARIFPTPFLEMIDNKNVRSFLVVSSDGFKAIQIDTKSEDSSIVGIIENIIDRRLGKKPGFFSPYGYKKFGEKKALHLGEGIFVYEDHTATYHKDLNPIVENCKLVEIDRDRADQILQENIRIVSEEKAQKIKEASQKVSGVLKTT